MDIRQLRLFIAVAEHLNFHRAAEQLNMAQPPLSLAIKKLESDLGVELFLRERKAVKLSAAGAAFLTEARRTVLQFEHAIELARQTGQGTVGHLRIAFVPSANYSCLVDVIRVFRQRYPDVNLDLMEATSTAIVKLLESNQIDIGFLRPESGISDKLRTASLEKDRFIAALPVGHRCANESEISLKELANDPFVAFSSVRSPTRSPTLYEQTLMLCKHAGFTPRIVQQANQVHTIVSLVSAGLGVALVPAAVSRLNVANVVYVPLRERATHMVLELMVAQREDDTAPAVLAFFELAKAVGKERRSK